MQPVSPQVLVAGVDPGQKGGIAIVNKASERIVFCTAMPVFEKKVGKTMRLRLDYGGLDELVDMMVDLGVSLLACENVGAGFGASGRELGEFVGALRMATYKALLRVEFVPAAKWKKELGAPADKKESYFRAEQLFPNDREALKGVKGGKHDGKAEAAMIALYGCRKLVG
jgi:predicted peroxiredoxin